MALVVANRPSGPEEHVPAEASAEEAGEFLRRDSNVDRMEHTFEVYKAKTWSLMQEQDPHLISRDVLSEIVTIQRRRFYGCLSLPFTILFFLFFAQSTYLHEDLTTVFVIESGLQQALGRDVEAVESIEGVWRWINETLVERLFVQADSRGRPRADKRSWSRVLGYNRLTGPLVLEQLRSEAELCQGGEGLAGDMTCFPQRSRSRAAFGRPGGNVTAPAPGDHQGGLATLEEREAYWAAALSAGRRLRTARPEYRGMLPGGLAQGDAFAAFLHPTSNLSLVRDHLGYLRERGWLDLHTEQLKVKALLLNAELGRPRLEHLLVVLAFSRSGGVFARVNLEPVFLRFWPSLASLGIDLVFLGALVAVTVMQLWQLRRAWRQGQLRRHLRSSWAVLEWLIVCGGWICIGLYLAQFLMLSGVRPLYEEAVEAERRDLPAESLSGEGLHDRAEWLTYANSWFRIFVALYLLLLMIRFFTAFHAQPRLGVVTSTLEVSLIDIVHFLVVVLPTFMGYAISGCFIFGRRIEDFATLEGAIGVCFKIFMESEYDWPDLTEEHYWASAFWTWSFMFLLVMLMLNMVLAIVLDVYTEIRKKSGQSETVWVTVVHMAQQLWQYKVWISNQELLQRIPAMGRTISREELLRTFPGMCKEQLSLLFSACRHQTEVSSLGSRSNEGDAKKLAMSVKLVMDKIDEATRQLTQGTLGPGPGLRGQAWLQPISRELAAQGHLLLSAQWQLQQLEWRWQALEALHGPGATFARERLPPEASALRAL